MAHKINYPSDGSVWFLSDLDKISVKVDGDSVDLSVSVGTAILYKQRLIPNAQNYVYMYGIRELLEAHIRTYVSIYTTCTIKAETPGYPSKTDTVVFNIITRFSRYSGPDQKTKRFLCSCPVRRIPDHVLVYDSILAHLDQGESKKHSFVFLFRVKETGELLRSVKVYGNNQVAAARSVLEIYVDFYEFAHNAAVSYDGGDGRQFNDDEIELLSFSLYMGERKPVTWFVDRQLKLTDCFMFYGDFNDQNLFACKATTVKKLRKTAENAKVNNSIVEYDREFSYSYETTTEPLTDEQARMFMTMLRSQHIFKFIAESPMPAVISISNMTAELSDDPQKPHSFKFEWCLCDCENDDLVVEENKVRIFSGQFDPAFS